MRKLWDSKRYLQFELHMGRLGGLHGLEGVFLGPDGRPAVLRELRDTDASLRVELLLGILGHLHRSGMPGRQQAV